MNNDIKPLAGKKAIVIGGSRGIGAAIVKRLAREGAAVVFTYVSRPDRARELVAVGGLDVLVNNAGILIFGNVEEYSLEDFDRMMAVNVRGVFVAAKAAANHLSRGGKIVVIGSNIAERAMLAGSAVYGMTKAAVARLVRGLALDLAPRGISVINVQPGPTTTDMMPADGPHVDWVRNLSPEKRIADPDEIARFVTYLARPESTYINGVSLTIDGAFSA
jgi:3-oxoacyl-[acyl-carrier protein] reductase